MKKKKIPMRKCIITNEMRPKKDMIRVVINKEGDILLMVLANNKVEALMFQKDVQSVEAAQEKAYLKDILMQILRS